MEAKITGNLKIEIPQYFTDATLRSFHRSWWYAGSSFERVGMSAGPDWEIAQ